MTGNAERDYLISPEKLQNRSVNAAVQLCKDCGQAFQPGEKVAIAGLGYVTLDNEVDFQTALLAHEECPDPGGSGR